MKAKTIQIVWHEKQPVFSLDFHPDGTLITSGGDKEIKLWEVRKHRSCFEFRLFWLFFFPFVVFSLSKRNE